MSSGIEMEMVIGNARVKRLQGDSLDDLILSIRQKKRNVQRMQRQLLKRSEKDSGTHNVEAGHQDVERGTLKSTMIF
jgi:hypothetical protein